MKRAAVASVAAIVVALAVLGGSYAVAGTAGADSKPVLGPGLVTGGVYRICRNPIFLGMFLSMAGLTVLLPTWLSLAVMLGTWASDIFAYFGGRLLGRHRLAPAISPKKTVEGFVIGLAAGIFTTWVTLYREGFTNPQALLVGVGVALAAPLGDLFESFLKRDLGVKDSGTLLAGHGGVLDRIDALLFAGPAALAIVALLGKA